MRRLFGLSVAPGRCTLVNTGREVGAGSSTLILADNSLC